MQELLPILRELGSMGLLAIVLVYIFRTWLPKRDQAFVNELRETREEHRRNLEKLWQKYDLRNEDESDHRKLAERVLNKIEQHLDKVANGAARARD